MAERAEKELKAVLIQKLNLIFFTFEHPPSLMDNHHSRLDLNRASHSDVNRRKQKTTFRGMRSTGRSHTMEPFYDNRLVGRLFL